MFAPSLRCARINGARPGRHAMTMGRKWLLAGLLLVVALGALAVFALVESTDDTEARQEPRPELLGGCGGAIIGDWFDNGRVDLLYEPGCYTAALNQLRGDGDPEIERRLAAAITRASRAADIGPDARIGVGYAHILYTHCGVESALFDGRLWLVQPPLNNGFGSPPPGWGNPTTAGIMRLLAQDEAVFRQGSLVARFIPAPPGYQRKDCD